MVGSLYILNDPHSCPGRSLPPPPAPTQQASLQVSLTLSHSQVSGAPGLSLALSLKMGYQERSINCSDCNTPICSHLPLGQAATTDLGPQGQHTFILCLGILVFFVEKNGGVCIKCEGEAGEECCCSVPSSDDPRTCLLSLFSCSS